MTLNSLRNDDAAYKDDHKTKKQLAHELVDLRSQNAEQKKSITGNRSAELAAEAMGRYAESIVETVREPLLVLDADLKIISANRNFYRAFKVTPGETIGMIMIRICFSVAEVKLSS